MVKSESGEPILERDEDQSDDRVAKKLKVEPVSIDDDVNDKIVKQLEYYFSDVNLVKDKFMQEQLSKNDMTVKLSVLLTFSRLAQLTKDENVIIQALKGHKSEVMELVADGLLIKRTKPIPNMDEFKKELDSKTVHISGFPDIATFEALHKFCSQYGEVESLSMRKHFKTKQFKGCIHVVYKDSANAKQVLETDDLKFKDRDLRRESMEQYYKRKEEIKEKRRQRKNGES